MKKGPWRAAISCTMIPNEYTSPFWVPSGSGFFIFNNSGDVHSFPAIKKGRHQSTRPIVWEIVYIPHTGTQRRENKICRGQGAVFTKIKKHVLLREV